LININAESSDVKESLKDELNSYSNANDSISAEYAKIEKKNKNSSKEDDS